MKSLFAIGAVALAFAAQPAAAGYTNDTLTANMLTTNARTINGAQIDNVANDTRAGPIGSIDVQAAEIVHPGDRPAVIADLDASTTGLRR
jgi:hypothetical protein